MAVVPHFCLLSYPQAQKIQMMTLSILVAEDDGKQGKRSIGRRRGIVRGRAGYGKAGEIRGEVGLV